MSEGSKIDSRRKSGVCSKHQRALASAIKRARQVGMVPIGRNHRFVIKQTYQRGPTPRTNDDNVSSVSPGTGQETTKEPGKTTSAESGKPAETDAAVDENKASAESDEPAEDTKQKSS